jgi:uncharacterized membrane protein YkoI
MRGRSNALIAVLHAVNDRIVYSVDVGSQEVPVDANSGIVVDIRPRD